ncbi:P27 family phage terminase small subunit [Streptococcus mutans]|nr:P27 family phage terminase small subunit [Streptococcus mutans]MCB5100744.1 P27 family phage terminase small subunit [Streptococcus mutans]
MSKPRLDVGTEKIKQYLLSRIDTDNPVEVEKVHRYVMHVAMYRSMNKTVKAEGVSVVTKNASQQFVKSHPLLAEMNRLNASIINIERTFNFVDDGENKPETHSASDLI